MWFYYIHSGMAIVCPSLDLSIGTNNGHRQEDCDMEGMSVKMNSQSKMMRWISIQSHDGEAEVAPH
jgi:hypothetical protein